MPSSLRGTMVRLRLVVPALPVLLMSAQPVLLAGEVEIPEWLRPAHEQMLKRRHHMKLAKPVLDLVPQNFDSVIQSINRTTIVAFGAPWCGHTRRIMGRYEEMAQRFTGTVDFGMIDVDAFPELKETLPHATLPAFFVLTPSSQGRPVAKFFGPRLPDVVEVWVGLWTGGRPLTVEPAWRATLTAYHIVISGLVALLDLVGVEPTDHGSGGGPLRDGGTLGVAGLVVGGLAALALLVALSACCCRRRARADGERKWQ
mmetsp:Transcript_68758/g.212617  ORF Transcript_68758/g.212617 Transcript_68758/m.212617 type:complete len:257 (+) Transcript_68758:63-833(+)